MTSKAFRNLSEAELELVAGGVTTSVVPMSSNDVLIDPDGRGDSSGSNAAGGGSGLDDLQETQPDLS